MELEATVGYLVALALPVWLLVEQVMYWQRSPDQPEKGLDLGEYSDKRASSPHPRGSRTHAMKLAHPRKIA